MKKFLTFILIVLFSIVILFLCAEFNLIDLTGAAYNNNIFFNRIVDNGLLIENDDLNDSNGIENRYYYNQLSNEGKYIYDSVISEKDNLKNGDYKINLDTNKLLSILNNNMLNYEFQNAINALNYDNLDLFYIDFTKLVLNTKTYISEESTRYELSIAPSKEYGNYFVSYITSKEDLENKLGEIEKIKNKLFKRINGSNYNKIKIVHDYLVDTISYDETYEKPYNRDIYGALVSKSVVCEGYARVFKYLLDELNIPCILVSGNSLNQYGRTESHMWNYVKINEIWYSVDVTWDDPIIEGNSNINMYKYKYFCQGDNINSDHFLEDKITENGQSFIYPVLYHKSK